MRLYHKLVYTNLSLITVRKEFSHSKRGASVKLLGLDFKYEFISYFPIDFL